MKSSRRIMLIGLLLIVQFFFWGVVTANTAFIWLAVINACLFVAFFGSTLKDYLVDHNIIVRSTVDTFTDAVKSFILHGGLVVVVALFAWYSIGTLLYMSQWLMAVAIGGIAAVLAWFVRDDVRAGNIYRGAHRMQGYHRWLLLAVVVTGLLFLRNRSGDVMKYIVSLGMGLLVFTIGLLSSDLSLRKIIRHPGWILYMLLTAIAGIWGLASRGMEHMVDTQRASGQLVVEEKEKIVYVPQPLEQGEDSKEGGAQNVDSEGEDSGTGSIYDCPIDACERDGTCVQLPLYASCVDDEDAPWLCDTGYIVKNNLCVPEEEQDENAGEEDTSGCTQDECLVKGVCIARPFRAYCNPSKAQGRTCERRYTQQGEECVIASIRTVVSTPVVEPDPEPIVPVVDTAEDVNLNAFIDPPTLLEKAQDNASQDIVEDRIPIEEDSDQQSVIQRRLEQALSPVTNFITNSQ